MRNQMLMADVSDDVSDDVSNDVCSNNSICMKWIDTASWAEPRSNTREAREGPAELHLGKTIEGVPVGGQDLLAFVFAFPKPRGTLKLCIRGRMREEMACFRLVESFNENHHMINNDNNIISDLVAKVLAIDILRAHEVAGRFACCLIMPHRLTVPSLLIIISPT